jgi:hypothetical protein
MLLTAGITPAALKCVTTDQSLGGKNLPVYTGMDRFIVLMEAKDFQTIQHTCSFLILQVKNAGR